MCYHVSCVMPCHGFARAWGHDIKLHDCHREIECAAQTCADVNCPTTPIKWPEYVQIEKENGKFDKTKSR